MPEWLYEAGIGEARAALIQDGRIIEARTEVDGTGPRHGAIGQARLIEITQPGRQGIVRLTDGAEALTEPLPRGLTKGAALLVEIIREAIGEPGKLKRAKARPADEGCTAADGPTLLERITATGLSVTMLASHAADRLEECGWSEVLEAAATGQLHFADTALRISLTPAMTLIDVDGHLPPSELALAGARQSAAAIRLFDLAGSIGIDLPTLGGKTERLAVADAFDAVMPLPFERTALNGFGFMQIIRPRHRASLCETLAQDPAAAAARALLRRAGRCGMAGSVRLVAHPAVVNRLQVAPDWLDLLGRSLGGTASLRADPGLAIGGGHVEQA